MLKHLEATRYVTPLREGGSLPAVIETDEPAPYVLKFRGAGQGPKALVAELISGELGRLLGLPVPEIAFVELAAGFGRSEPDPEIQDLLRASVGLNLGLRYLPGAVNYEPAAVPDIDPDLAAAIVWFDAFVTNVDRTPRNTNMLIWRRDLYLIDHGSTLYFHHNWTGYEGKIRRSFPAIRQHVLLPLAGNIEQADERLSARLDERAIRGIVDLVPESWLAGERHFETIESNRRAYVDYLMGRLAAPRPFVEEIKSARAAAAARER